MWSISPRAMAGSTTRPPRLGCPSASGLPRRRSCAGCRPNRLVVVLKARQLGLSWLCMAYALWLLLTQAPATVLLFSQREAEAVELLGRLRGMYDRLPHWLRARRVLSAAATVWSLSNGSRALAFSTHGGRSYTATLAIVDEADYVPDLGRFLNGVKPTVDAGGQLILISTSDKRRPTSPFKNLFRGGAGRDGRLYRGLSALVRATGPRRRLGCPHPRRDARPTRLRRRLPGRVPCHARRGVGSPAARPAHPAGLGAGGHGNAAAAGKPLGHPGTDGLRTAPAGPHLCDRRGPGGGHAPLGRQRGLRGGRRNVGGGGDAGRQARTGRVRPAGGSTRREPMAMPG